MPTASPNGEHGAYTGPSRACATCKNRRVKCDETRPFCRNCTRRNVPCPDFADPLGTAFKDETEAIRRSFRRAENERRLGRHKENRDLVSANLAQDEDFVVLCFMFNNYVMAGNGVQSSRGVYGNLAPYDDPNDSGSLISAAVASLATSRLSMWRPTQSHRELIRGGLSLYSRAHSKTPKVA